MSDKPYPDGGDTMHYELHTAWDEGYAEGFAAGRAAATPDPPTDERRPWPIAPDTVMPPRRQPVRWGSRADDPPTEIHDDPEKTKAYLAGLAAGRTEAAAASPDERLREADRAALVESIAQTERFRGGPCLCSDCVEKRADAEATVDAVLAALAATDRDKPDECRAPHCWSEYGTPCGTCPETGREESV